MTSTLNSAEVAVLLLVTAFAVAAGIATVAGVIMARERREWRDQIDDQAREIVSLRAQVKTLTDIVVANYPSAAVAIDAGGSVTLGAGIAGRDRVGG